MYFRKSKDGIDVFRHEPARDGKRRDRKIGTLAHGTRPNAIPQNIIENVTPLELGELEEHLRGEIRSGLPDTVKMFINTGNRLLPDLSGCELEMATADELETLLAKMRTLLRTTKPIESRAERAGAVDKRPENPPAEIACSEGGSRKCWRITGTIRRYGRGSCREPESGSGDVVVAVTRRSS